MKAKGKPAEPAGLSAANKKLWASITSGWTLSEEGLAVLAVALEAKQRGDEAAALLRADGLVIRTARGSVRPHPANRIRERAEAAFLQAMRQLGLE